ncbi:DMT family transporter [Notoacmeibacter sp. MSK16QG-6]|uniref:DMT family transporter n=1 Tax=Notoacmeibacter sp. MSK16QG-6 TaxID=2957982 RepID=UPI0020A0577E|nr:DMT family transporter [Notoacmeibacter sp. MSK16QG-6]MCP1199845.1 DMT family transporter [Notoacmeibacter sp. MSK16QG-6]
MTDASISHKQVPVRRRFLAGLTLLAAGAIWGGGFVAQSTAMDSLGPFAFIAARFAVAFFGLLPFALIEVRRARITDLTSEVTEATLVPEWGGYTLAGLAFFAGMATQQIGLVTTSVSNSGFLTSLYVVFTPFIAFILFREMPRLVIIPASFMALTGIFLLSGGMGGQLSEGDWWTIACAGFWGLQVALTGRLAERTGLPITLTAVQMAMACLVALPITLVFETTEVWQLKVALPEILYTGLFAGGLAFSLQARGQRYVKPGPAAILLSSEALFAALFGAILLGERLAPIALIGCGLILAAILIAQWPQKRRNS